MQRVFQMSVLIEIGGATRRGRRQNLDTLKELDIEKDIIGPRDSI